ncbi:MAG: NADH-quinone oxidoreductase subunit D [Deltaproteobacteria bacterium]|nr:NADH-quinone oxidoreductase subunit D [Deltaproteobacteria bacterium]
MTADLKTSYMTINMGPQHPSTHGVIRFILKTNGEIIYHCEPDIGYLHRSIEKIAESVTWQGFVPYTDRVDYVCSMNANWAYCLAVEKMMGIEIPERAEYIRVIVGELNRISSHLIAIGTADMDMGAVTPFVHCLREREYINDLLERVCGARLTYNYMTIGGVANDLPADFIQKTVEFLNHFEFAMEQINRLVTYNRIFINRFASLGVITPEQAINYNLVGPNLRGSGVNYDLRKDEPYSIYSKLDFDIPVGTGSEGILGDCYDRYIVRAKEIKESVKLIRQCLNQLPSGEIQAKVKNVIKPPQGHIYVRTETPRGDTGYFLYSNNKTSPYRLKIRTGSFTAMSIIPEISQGLFIADLVALIGSLDVVAPEVDR